jgi:hypothetical protein
MTHPIVFISHNRVRDGKLDDFRRFFRAGAGAIERDKPGTITFLAYADEDGDLVDIVHVFPDADAMDRHLEGARERSSAADEFIEGTGVDIYGAPSDAALSMMHAFATDSAPLRVRAELVGGYLRPTSERPNG